MAESVGIYGREVYVLSSDCSSSVLDTVKSREAMWGVFMYLMRCPDGVKSGT
jgi:hypothetical protein